VPTVCQYVSPKPCGEKGNQPHLPGKWRFPRRLPQIYPIYTNGIRFGSTLGKEIAFDQTKRKKEALSQI